MPIVRSLAIWKLQDLEEMAIRVAEIERADTARVRVPVGQPLRSRRCVLDVKPSQARIRLAHVPDDDGRVLKAHIVRPYTRWHRSAFGRQVLGQLDCLSAEAEPDDAHPCAE